MVYSIKYQSSRSLNVNKTRVKRNSYVFVHRTNTLCLVISCSDLVVGRAIVSVKVFFLSRFFPAKPHCLNTCTFLAANGLRIVRRSQLIYHMENYALF